MTHICISRLTVTGSDNGLSPGRRQAIIWTNDGILLIGPLGTNFSENLIWILTFSFTKMWLKVSSAKWLPFCLSLNVLINHWSSVTPTQGTNQGFAIKNYWFFNSEPMLCFKTRPHCLRSQITYKSMACHHRKLQRKYQLKVAQIRFSSVKHDAPPSKHDAPPTD